MTHAHHAVLMQEINRLRQHIRAIEDDNLRLTVIEGDMEREIDTLTQQRDTLYNEVQELRAQAEHALTLLHLREAVAAVEMHADLTPWTIQSN